MSRRVGRRALSSDWEHAGIVPAAVFVWLLVLVLLSTAMGLSVLLALRRHERAAPAPGQEAGLLRVRARIATGREQAVVGLVTRLGLSVQSDLTGYGELYLVPSSDYELVVRSRSEIGRGFLGVLRFGQSRRSTVLEYSIVRLPLDEDVRGAVQTLELRLVMAVRDLDHSAAVQLTGSALSGSR